MSQLDASYARQSALLSTILKTIRGERRLTQLELANAMGIAEKTYENFEAGRGRLNFDRIKRFAEATRSDALAIVHGVMFEDPEIAYRAMDNKSSTILWLAHREFSEDVGDAVSLLPGTAVFEAFRQAFAALKELLARRRNGAEHWLEQEISRLYRGGERSSPED
ncbi:helix-turn-helix transcriptional regulator [Caulobacter segnis]|uniref:XRE family transcriptional regulator n=1 Tax=Caulobacter segnis TaxID=88688 RepID=A0A2W5V5T2_9CAUL|nr:helix-turn-helix transcriptional regulator [Caulobacter segnis]PZR34097.1 MAG: XRE family transcriptional regulator [Caulobacter segnis]